MQVQLNDSVGFGYNTRFVYRGSRRLKRMHLPLIKSVQKSVITSKYNPYGPNSDLKVVINAFDIRRLIDQCRYRKPIKPNLQQYQLSVRFYKDANTLPLKMKKLRQSLKVLFHPFQSKYKLVNKPRMVILGEGGSFPQAVADLCDKIEAVARRLNNR